jgi:hypothetical protein
MKKLAISIAVALAIFSVSGCSTVHDAKPTGEVIRASSHPVIAQLDYAENYYKSPNKETFGDLGGTDCVNFVSQTLLSRGWKLNPKWTYTPEFTRPWISSTGFREYLLTQPELATELLWKDRDLVQVGDVVQFDWDNSGDRDHTAIVSGIQLTNGKREILISSHSPASFDWSITEQLAEQDDRAQVYFWQLAE